MRSIFVSFVVVLFLGAAGVVWGQDAGKGEATVYFIWGKEWPQRHLLEIWSDGDELAKLENGTFFGARLEAGKHVFKTQNDSDEPLTVDLGAGKAYCVEAKWVSGGLKGHHILHLLDPRIVDFVIKDPQKLKLKKLSDEKLVDRARILP